MVVRWRVTAESEVLAKRPPNGRQRRNAVSLPSTQRSASVLSRLSLTTLQLRSCLQQQPPKSASSMFVLPVSLFSPSILLTPRRPNVMFFLCLYPSVENVIRTHFRLKSRVISAQLDKWLAMDDGCETLFRSRSARKHPTPLNPPSFLLLLVVATSGPNGGTAVPGPNQLSPFILFQYLPPIISLADLPPFFGRSPTEQNVENMKELFTKLEKGEEILPTD